MKSVIWNIVQKVTHALYESRSIFITWPTAEEAEANWTAIETRHDFPKVIGGLDGSHINIPAPHDQPEAYINRKGRHSIQLQVMIFLFFIFFYIKYSYTFYIVLMFTGCL